MIQDPIARVKKLFLDRAEVTSRLDKGTATAFRIIGARVRLNARNSIRKAPKKRRSTGRRAPYDRTGRLKKFIFFSLDRETDSLVVGPVKLESVAAENAPELLEYGGIGRNSKTGESVEYEAFPYMTPAFERERPRISDAFQNVVK